MCNFQFSMGRKHGKTNPEINIQVPTTAKLAIPDLKCHRHPVVLVQLLVEAFSRMRLQLDVVRHRTPWQGAQDGQKGELKEPHDSWRKV